MHGVVRESYRRILVLMAPNVAWWWGLKAKIRSAATFAYRKNASQPWGRGRVAMTMYVNGFGTCKIAGRRVRVWLKMHRSVAKPISQTWLTGVKPTWCNEIFGSAYKDSSKYAKTASKIETRRRQRRCSGWGHKRRRCIGYLARISLSHRLKTQTVQSVVACQDRVLWKCMTGFQSARSTGTKNWQHGFWRLAMSAGTRSRGGFTVSSNRSWTYSWD